MEFLLRCDEIRVITAWLSITFFIIGRLFLTKPIT